MTETGELKYNMAQILTSMDFFMKYSAVWQAEIGEEFFTRDHWFVFNECCRSKWQNRSFTISDAIRTMPWVAPAVARTRIEEAERAGFLEIVPSETDGHIKHVLPSEVPENKVKGVFVATVDLFRDTLENLADEGPLPKR